MAIKTVLAALDVAKFDKDLESAITFCETHEAHLTALVVSLGSAPYIGTYDMESSVWVEERQRELDHIASAAEATKVLSRSGISWDVQNIYTEFAWAADNIAARALYADLVLIGPQAARAEEFRKRVIDGALFHSPTPIMLNPSVLAIDPAPKTVLLAWDSSDEAARAARQSMDFLLSASAVHVTLVDPIPTRSTDGEESGAKAVTFLSRHGIKADVNRIATRGRSVAETLRQHAIDVSADMIVMGAYNHSRLRQAVLRRCHAVDAPKGERAAFSGALKQWDNGRCAASTGTPTGWCSKITAIDKPGFGYRGLNASAIRMWGLDPPFSRSGLSPIVRRSQGARRAHLTAHDRPPAMRKIVPSASLRSQKPAALY